MDIRVHWYDVTAEDLKATAAPVVSFERAIQSDTSEPKPFAVAEPAREGIFWVPQRSIFSAECPWSMVSQGKIVRVPLAAYQSKIENSRSALFGLGVEIGIRAVQLLVAKVNAPPVGANLIIGTRSPQAIDGKGYRAFIGLAFRMN